MKKWLLLLLLPVLAGCATIDGDCPADGSMMEVAIGGSTVGTTAIQTGVGAAKAAGLVTAAAAPAPIPFHVHYTYVPIFGSDYVMCGKLPSSMPPPIIVTSPPASIVH